MVLVSEAYTSVPEICNTPLQEKVYQVLQELDMAFQRVETEEVITMEDCQQINERLEMDMVKTLFLCNRQKKFLSIRHLWRQALQIEGIQSGVGNCSGFICLSRADG